jgi:RNA polymerase sigma-70 factor (ECF subfamily)
MNFNDDDAQALLQRIWDGDQSAMRELYRRLSQRTYAYTLRMVKDACLAEEIVVDTMVKIWQNRERFRGESKLSTWAIGIARNTALSRLRQENRTLEFSVPLPGHEHGETDDDALDLLEAITDENQKDPLDVVSEKQRREGIRKCIEKLPAKYQECLHLVHYEDMTFSEAAALLNCNENTLKGRMSVAREKIKNCVRLWLRRERNNE